MEEEDKIKEESDTFDEEPSSLVKVTGFSSETTKDGLLNFFENTRRSGGGKIKDIQLNEVEGIAEIIFWSSQDAKAVVQNDNLELDGTKMTAVLMKKLPKELSVDQRRLHVMGLNDTTAMDGLNSFLEEVTGGEVESILFGSNSDCLVSFKETIDFHKVQRMCKNNLDYNYLGIEEVKICDCIQVSGLAPKTTRDALFYYFRKRRNGGGDVKRFEFENIDVSRRRLLISFEDPEVLESVMKQDHIVDDVRLTVRRYYPFLGETSLNNPAGPEKNHVIKVGPKTMMVIKDFLIQEFDKLVQERHVKYTWQQESGEIVLGCDEPKMDKKTWENSCAAVVAYINQIVTEKITTSHEIWRQLSNEAMDKCSEFENQISILHIFEFKKKENSIVLRGKKTDVCGLAKQLQDLVSRVEKQIVIEKSKISKKLELNEVQMDLLISSGYVDGLKTGHEGLEVTVVRDSNDQIIKLRGLEKDVNECAAFVWQTLSRVEEDEMEFSKSVVDILGTEKGKAFISTSFKNNSIEAIISFDSTSYASLMITAMDRDHIDKAVEFIKNATIEESIPLDKDQKKLVETVKWKEIKHSIQGSVPLQVNEELAASTLWIVGIKEEVHEAKKNLERFFQDNVVSDKVIEVGTGIPKYLFRFELDSIKKIEESLRKYSVKVTKISDESDGTILVSGTKEGIMRAVEKVKVLVDSIKPGLQRNVNKL